MNKLGKKLAVLCMAGSMVTAGGVACCAEEITQDTSSNGVLENMISRILPDASEEDINAITDSISAVVNDEGVQEAVQEFIDSEEVQDVIEFSVNVWNQIPDEEKEQLMGIFSGLFTDEFGIQDPEPLDASEFDEEMQEVREITKDEAEEYGFHVNLPEGMTLDLYTLTDDEELGNIFSAVISSDDTYLTYTMFSTDKTDLDEIDYASMVSFFMGDDAEVTDAKAGDFDAQVTIVPSEKVGMIDWIDTENGTFYRLEGISLGFDDAPEMTAQQLEELASFIFAPVSMEQ